MRRLRELTVDRIWLEQLEDRRLMAVSLTGVPSWVEQGPGPIVNGQTEGLTDNPVTGAVEAIAVRPGAPATVLIGSTEGGIWRTTNINASPVVWTPLSDQMPSLAISSIAFSPFDTSNQTLFAGTHNGSFLRGGFSNGSNAGGTAVGILKSTDLGNTWRVIGATTFNTRTIRRVVPAVQTLADGTRVHIVLVASTRGVHRSTTGGEATATGDGFTGISGQAGSGLPSGSVSDLVADPGRTGRFYAAIPGTGIFRTSDFGATWAQVDQNGITGVANTNHIELAVHFNPERITRAVYAALVNPGTRRGALNSVWRSGSDGLGWTQIGTAPAIHPGNQGINNLSIVADPEDHFTVYVAGDRQANAPFVANAFKGEGRTNTWSSIVRDGAGGTAPHADTRFMVFSGSDILEADDGGIYRLNNAASNTRRWVPLVGNLRVTQMVSAAYDPVRNRLVAGSQDTGSFNQSGVISGTQADRFRWETMLFAQGDGVTVDVDMLHRNLIGDVEPQRYASSQMFGFFQSVGGLPIPDFVELKVEGTGLFPRRLSDRGILAQPVNRTNTGAFDSTLAFNNEYQLNRVAARRMVIGTNFLYESTNGGDDLRMLGEQPDARHSDGVDNDFDGATDEGDEFVPDPQARVGKVNSIAYGGRRNGTDNPDALLVGTDGVPDVNDIDGDGNITELTGFLRARFVGTGLPGPRLGYEIAGGAAIRDLVMDPADCRRAWILDVQNRVWLGTNINNPGENWVNLTGNLSGRFFTITVVGSGASAVPLVGGSDGVFRLDPNSGIRFWQEFGAGLPNAQVSDLRYVKFTADNVFGELPDRDVLVAATVGRGAWTIRNVSNFIASEPVLQVDGTSAVDNIFISRNPLNPLLLDVSDNGVKNTFQLSLIKRIVVNTHDGDDFLLLDGTGGPLDLTGSGGGPVFVPGGLAFHGGNGVDSFLSLGAANQDDWSAEPGSAQLNNRLTYADGSVMAITINATQLVVDEVVSPTMTVIGTVNENNITLSDGESVGDGRLRVQMNDVTHGVTYSALEFSGKNRLSLIGDAFSEIFFGSRDTITLSNTEPSDRPLMTALVVESGFGDDIINVQRAPVATTITAGDGADVISFGRTVVDLGAFATSLNGIDAPVSVNGGPGTDTVNFSATSTADGALSGDVNNTFVTGFALASAVNYASANLNITLGPTNDSIRVRSTASGATTSINTGGGADFIRLGSGGTTNTASGTGNLNNILGAVTVTAGAGADNMVLDDSGDPAAANSGTLTSTAVSGLGMTSGINYGGLESLTLHLGGGADTLNVSSLAAITSAIVNTSGGADAVTLGGQSVNNIRGPLTINTGAGAADTVILQEFEPAGLVNVGSLGTPPNAGSGTGFLTGFGMGARVDFINAEGVSIIEGPSNDLVSFAFESPPLFGINLSLDGGTDGVVFQGTDRNDRIHVSRRVGPAGPEVIAEINGRTIIAGYQGGETVSVLAGAGNDLVSVDESVTTWRAELFGGDGNDHLTGGVLGDLLDGGAGHDYLASGDGDDELIGGAGHDIFYGGAGTDRIRAGDRYFDVIFADLADLLFDLDPRDLVVRR